MARCPDIRCLPLPSHLRSYEGSPQKILLFGHGLNHMVENLYGCSNLAGKSDLTGKLNTFTEVIASVLRIFFGPRQREARFRICIGSGRRAASRLFKL